ncbi:sulfatase-like hydrolase/transferase [bacterium]|nr:sulfatase-like hydrolase/transferase [bacterium]
MRKASMSKGNRMSRRKFIQTSSGAVVAAGNFQKAVAAASTRATTVSKVNIGRKPMMNVIVIIADSMRADHVGCYGSKIKTPNLDRLARESVVFEQAYSENLPTMPCRTAWWTGQYLFTERGWQQMRSSDYLLAEVLWDEGVTSAFITDTYHMHKPVYNCGRGFDTVVFVRGQEYDPWIVDKSIKVDLKRYHRLKGDGSDRRWKPRFEQYLRNTSWFKKEEDYSVARTVKEAIRWLEHTTKTRKDGLFLWIDCFDPHEPWDPPSPYREMYDPGYRGLEMIDPIPGMVEGYMTPREVQHTRALYAGEVTFVDKWIGILLDRIRALGLYENTLIVFMSDHGEPLGEHGYVRKAFPRNYEELARIPWIMRFPDGLGAGERFSSFIQPPDLMPTILDSLGVAKKLTLRFLAPVGLTFPQDMVQRKRDIVLTGKSLQPLLRGEVEELRDFAVTAHYKQQWGLRTRDWTYLYHPRKHRPNELYNRKKDVAEQNNLIEKHPEVVEELENHLLKFAEAVAQR